MKGKTVTKCVEKTALHVIILLVDIYFFNALDTRKEAQHHPSYRPLFQVSCSIFPLTHSIRSLDRELYLSSPQIYTPFESFI